jgi:cation transport ATPase
LARAVAGCAATAASDSPPDHVRTLPGRGLAAAFCDLPSPVYLGSARLMHDHGLAFGPRLAAAVAECDRNAAPVACLGWEGRLRAVFVLHEALRPNAAAALAACRELGLATVLVTGDRAARAARVGAELGITVLAELLPGDKVAAVRDWRRLHGKTAMVGDGINDAPALAASDVGIALGCGADLTRDSAEICLLGDDLQQVAWCIVLARRTRRIVRQNLVWAFAYNTMGIALAAFGSLTPVWAAAAMLASGTLVVANSLRLRAPPELPTRPTDAHARPSLDSRTPQSEEAGCDFGLVSGAAM